MKKLMICLVAMICLGLLGAVALSLAAEPSAPSPPLVKPGPGHPGSNFEPLPDETLLPDLGQLPVPPRFKQTARKYVGVIKNNTRYDVFVPSHNSEATLTIPARGYIEYISYEKSFDVTVYRDGKPFYCLKINAHPREYAYMCKNDYDFIAEIVKPEPVAKQRYRKLKRAIKHPRPEGDEETG